MHAEYMVHVYIYVVWAACFGGEGWAFRQMGGVQAAGRAVHMLVS
jgi:uncharacterized membrane protein YecN with MAPEG domain